MSEKNRIISCIIALLMLVILFGILDLAILEFSITGDGSDPPIHMSVLHKIIYYLVLYPLIFFIFVYILFYRPFGFKHRLMLMIFLPNIVILEIVLIFFAFFNSPK
jgi:hypothetical protein